MAAIFSPLRARLMLRCHAIRHCWHISAIIALKVHTATKATCASCNMFLSSSATIHYGHWYAPAIDIIQFSLITWHIIGATQLSLWLRCYGFHWYYADTLWLRHYAGCHWPLLLSLLLRCCWYWPIEEATPPQSRYITLMGRRRAIEMLAGQLRHDIRIL